MVRREGRAGPFFGCREYPQCRETMPVGLPGLACPECAGPIVERHAKKSGRAFWPCGRRGCDFVSWTKPHPCRACGRVCFGLEPAQRALPLAVGLGRPAGDRDEDGDAIPF
jgi:DNA topoisomerase-1